VKLFRRHVTPEDLGGMIYEGLRSRLATNGPFSVGTLVRRIGKSEADLPEHFVGVIMVGSMFGAVLAIERSTGRVTAERIIEGMLEEFFRHLHEQGASARQVREWKDILAEHFRVYRSSLEGYEGFEPPWKLGRQFLWGITGVEEFVAAAIKGATLHVLAAQEAAQDLVNRYGPALSLNITHQAGPPFNVQGQARF
jgi:hypothetical protein